MKFKVQVGGLLAGLKPMFAVATKGTMDKYPGINLVTMKACQGFIEAIADGGHVSASNEISNETYNLGYECTADGVATVNATDLNSSLSSFAPSTFVIFEIRDGKSGGRELVIHPEGDDDEIQSLPVQNEHCEYHEPDSKKKIVSITIRRDTFISYANKISFAHGEQEQFKNFRYWMLKAIGTNALRFAAGSGTRFALAELEGNNLSDSKGTSSIYFPNDQTQPVISVLGELKCQDIVIESQDRSIVISCGKTKISIYTCDPSIEWPDENKFLERQSKYNFTTKVGNWKYAIKGIIATNDGEDETQDKIHSCRLSIDFAKRIIQASTSTSLKSCRKVQIEDIATNEDNKEIVVSCVANYINEIISKASDDDYLQFEIDALDKPIMVRYYAGKDAGDAKTFKKPTEDGTNERYSVFFATLKA